MPIELIPGNVWPWLDTGPFCSNDAGNKNWAYYICYDRLQVLLIGHIDCLTGPLTLH